MSKAIKNLPLWRTFAAGEHHKLAKERVGQAQLIDLLPSDTGWRFAEQLIQAEHPPMLGFRLQRVRLIHNPSFLATFEKNMALLNNRAGNAAFRPRWAEREEYGLNALRESIMDRFHRLSQPYATERYRGLHFLPLWHATSAKLLPSILSTGFANLATTDLGYFGKGIYGSTHAEYAKRVYGGGYHQGALLLLWAGTHSPFPVAGRADIERLKGRGNHANYDAHFIPIKPINPYNPEEVF